MINKHCLRAVTQPGCTSTALLLLRVIAGIAFAIHGFGKIQSPMNWMGPDSPVPGIFQLLAGISEFGGGICWILGLFTPIASILIAATMLVATCFHAFIMKDPFVNPTGGGSYELASVYFAVALTLLMAGAGRFSIDAKVFGEKSADEMK